MFGSFRGLLRDESGGLTPLILVLFVGIVLTTGFALDLLRQEAESADLQDALDRGVLAAASLTQTVDAETVVGEYLANRSIAEAQPNWGVAITGDLSYRRVDASAGYQLDTLFLRLAGLETLPVVVNAAAEQGVQNIEIALVLDISGSMAREYSGTSGQKRLDVLKVAASNFIDTVLTADTVDRTMISLVPYAGQVNAGPLFDDFNSQRVHSYSSCIEFFDSDLTSTTLPAFNSRPQVPHFQWFRFEGYYGNEAEWGWCPSDRQGLIPYSNDAAALKARIAGFVGHDGTGTQNALKWGLGLLDPAAAPVMQRLIDDGLVDPDFAGGPGAYGDKNVLKVVVLMTDGNIRYQQRPKARYYDSPSERSYFARNYLRSQWATLRYSSQRTADEAFRTEQFLALCQKAKEKGAIVFTIGFDVPEGGDAYSEMLSCASSPGHFYHVEGLDLISAFDQIAATITKLRLIL